MFTNCNHGGVVDMNWKLVEFQTGIKQLAKGYQTVIKSLGNRTIYIRDNYYFLPKFITFQYPGFPRSNVKQQQGAIKILLEFNLFDEEKQTLTKELNNSYEDEDVNDNVIVNDNVNILFNEFWEKYHSLTGKPKTDKDATLKYWKKLKDSDRKKAIEMIHPYSQTETDPKYLKKARTYLSDKNFNDQFKVEQKASVLNQSDNVQRIQDEDYDNEKYIIKPES